MGFNWAFKGLMYFGVTIPKDLGFVINKRQYAIYYINVVIEYYVVIIV
jgi:hypothetical protein